MVVIGSFSCPGIGRTLGLVVAGSEVPGDSVSVSLCDGIGEPDPPGVVGLPEPCGPSGPTTGTVVCS